MRFYLGRIFGSLVGAFGGLPGIAFGFLLGYLADLLLTDHQVKKEAKLFLVNSSDGLRWAPQIPVLVAGLAVSTPTGDVVTAAATIAAIRALLRNQEMASPGQHRWTNVLRWNHGRRWSRSMVEPVVDIAVQLGGSIDREHLLSYAREHLSDSHRATAIAACSQLFHDDSVLRQTATDLDVDPEVVSELLRARRVRRRDPEACVVLGVSEDASLVEIKRSYRRLAAQFHPDTTAGLSPEQQEASSAAFLKIRTAYEQLTGATENTKR